MENAETIKSLPDEVLLKILTFLDTESMFNATLVCKRWKDIIIGSTRTMQAFTLILRTHQEYKREAYLHTWNELMKVRRKFVNAKIQVLLKKDTEIMQVFNVHHLHLKSLCVSFTDIQFSTIMKILAKAVNLESLSFENVWTFRSSDSGADDEVVQTVQLKKLKRIVIKASHSKFLTFIKTPQLEELEIHSPMIEPGMEGGCLDDGFRRMFASSHKLERISFEGNHTFTIFGKFLSSNPLFKLKKLTVKSMELDEIRCRYSEVEKSLTEILKAHANHLEELEMKTVGSLSMCKLVLTKLKALKKLSLNARNLPTKEEFNESYTPLKTIKDITFREKFYDNPTAKHVLSFFTHVESLTLDMSNEFVLLFLSGKLPDLKRLSVRRVPFSHRVLNLYFPKLTHFHADDIRSMDNMRSIFIKNPTIEHFSIKEIYLQAITVHSVEAITLDTSIKSLKLQGGLKAMKEFFDIVKDVGWNSQMKTMELIVKNMNEDFARPFFFNLPKDKSTWNAKCDYLDNFKWTKEFS